jgi:hypothetical protein
MPQRPAAAVRPGTGTRPAGNGGTRPAGQTGRGQAVSQDWAQLLRRAWQVAAPGASRVRMTARGALVGIFGSCLAFTLVASVLHVEVLVGLGFCAACVLAPAYATRQALLEVVVAPPITLLLAVIIVQALTAQGDSTHASMLSVLEGTLLTLAAAAPWLFAGMVLCVLIAVRRGLPQCVRDLLGRSRDGAGAGAARS